MAKIYDFSYIDSNDNIIEIPIVEVDFWYNMNKYQQALMVYQENKDTYEFAKKILPEMILTPSELRKVETFENDFTSLADLMQLLIEMQTKKLKAQPNRKIPRLEMD